MWVAGLLFHQDVGWDLTVDAHPSLALQLYRLFVLISLVVGVASICRSWILVPPFRHVPTEIAYRAATTFRRQAVSIRRWMILNVLGWGAITVTELIDLFRGMWVSRTVGMQVIAVGLEDVLRPSGVLFLTLIVLYVLRWHILWRAERLERRRGKSPEPSQDVAGIIRNN